MNLNTWLLINYSSNNNAMFPIGIAYISSVLKQANKFSVHCLDLAFVDRGQHEQSVLDALRTTGAGVIGINGFSNEFNSIKSILTSVRSYSEDIILVAGGHMVSSDPERIHSWLALDFAVVGEAEETILELANAIASETDYTNISGIVYKNGNKSVKTSERKVKNDIDHIPFPDYVGFDLPRYLDRQREFPSVDQTNTDNPRVVPIVAARSCPYKCTFCSHSIKQYRKRSLDSIFEEIDLLVSSFGATGVGIYDDLFATDSKRLEDFCQRISTKSLTWTCQLRADMADRNLLKHLRSSGCTCISYGFESMHDDVLRSMKKQLSPRFIKSAATITYESKLTLQANFIFGDSAETIESIDKTMNWWAANRVYGVNLATILVFPGTALYDDFVKRGVITNELEYIEYWSPFGRSTKMPSFLNGTQIPTVDYDSFAYGFKGSHSLTIPCYVSHIEVNSGYHVVVNVICPHCGAELKYGGSSNFAPDWVACRQCFARFRIPVRRAFGRSIFSAEQTDHVAKAIQLIHKHKFDESKELVKWAAAEEISDVDAINALATATMLLGDLEQSLDLFRRALNLEPANAIAHNNYGIGLGFKGMVGWSLLHFRQAILLDNLNISQANADFAHDWLQKNYNTIPFVQKLEGYPNHTSIAIPTLSDGSPCIRRAPLRESLANHPLGGISL